MRTVVVICATVWLVGGCGAEEPASQAYALQSVDELTLYCDGVPTAKVVALLIDGKTVWTKGDGIPTKYSNPVQILFSDPPIDVVMFKALMQQIKQSDGITPQTKNIRNTISVITLQRDDSDASRWDIEDAFPILWEPGEYTPSSNVCAETIVAKMQRLVLG